jgi:hypothetical protein
MNPHLDGGAVEVEPASIDSEFDVVFRPTRRDRAVIGLPPEREQTR